MTSTITQAQKLMAQKIMERLAQEAMQKVANDAIDQKREAKILNFCREVN